MLKINRVTAFIGIIIMVIMTMSIVSIFPFRNTINDLFGNDSIYERILNTRDKTNESFNQVHPLVKYPLIEINGTINLALGKKYFNEVVKLNDSFLTDILTNDDSKYALENADKVIKLNDYLKSLDIPLLYLQAPKKDVKNLLPVGIDDYSGKCADIFINELNNADISNIDLRHKVGVGNADTFFRTDHHWLPEAAFRAFQIVGTELNLTYGFNIDTIFFEKDNYNYNVYNDWFLGSHGKRVGVIYSEGVDDITIITPKFYTSFNLRIYYDDKPTECVSGNFSETMIIRKYLDKKSFYTLTPYTAYTGDEFLLQIMINNNQTDGKRVLLVCDSFVRPFSPFLALGCKELCIFDCRRYTNGTLYEYIEEYQPDMVIFLYYADQASKKSSLFDFE